MGPGPASRHPTGVRISLQAEVQCYSATKNSPSALAQGEAVEHFVQKQLEQGYMLAPFTKQEEAGIITSSLVATPKKTSGQWRTIVNLLSSAHASVNDNLMRKFTLPKFDPSLHLSIADVEFVRALEQDTFLIHIKTSKKDQFRSGATVALGSTKAELCPVAALLDYLNMWGAASGPLFLSADETPLHRQAFVKAVQEALQAVGIDGSLFNGHSFPIGAATTASAAGVAKTTIKTLRCWSSLAY